MVPVNTHNWRSLLPRSSFENGPGLGPARVSGHLMRTRRAVPAAQPPRTAPLLGIRGALDYRYG